jgi:hypothetical protein
MPSFARNNLDAEKGEKKNICSNLKMENSRKAYKTRVGFNDLFLFLDKNYFIGVSRFRDSFLNWQIVPTKRLIHSPQKEKNKTH